jgi:hypothetical protein
MIEENIIPDKLYNLGLKGVNFYKMVSKKNNVERDLLFNFKDIKNKMKIRCEGI